MSRPVHESFTLVVTIAAGVPEVRSAFGDPRRKRLWLRMPGRDARYTDDFRVGGQDTASATFAHEDGVERIAGTTTYLHLSPTRLVWAYRATVDDAVRWCSLVTVDLVADGESTVVTWTEQVVYPSGSGPDDLPHLRGGVRLRLNGLAAAAGAAPGPPLA